MPGPSKEPLFDRAAEYEEMLQRGLRLSGESADYFVEGRLKAMLARVEAPERVASVVDFGCGIGGTTAELSRRFARAAVAGVETAEGALAAARARYGSERLRFQSLEEFEADGARYELGYMNGVMHHIPVRERAAAMRLIRLKMAPGGRFFLFENNPWNPGARMVMRRIEFDRDAVMVWPGECARLMEEAGLRVVGRESLFFFPRALGWLRGCEGALGGTMLGAQYLVVGQAE